MPERKVAFCTVFDKNYLYQGIALYDSLLRHSSSFILYCLCMDDISADALRTLGLESVRVVTLQDLSAPWLSGARVRMSWAQLCWTMQPAICAHLLDLGEPAVTYLEADSYFFDSPEILLEEIGTGSVSLVPHSYSEVALKHEETSGVYCVQFNYFKNDSNGRQCLEYWLGQCLEYDQNRPGHSPGQLCLNEWEKRFKGVVVIQNPGAGVAPWNVQKYTIGEGPTVNSIRANFYHYHQLARLKNGSFDLGHYPLSRRAIDEFYRPYIRAVFAAEARVKAAIPGYDFKREQNPPPSFREGLWKWLTSFETSTLKLSTLPMRRRIKGTHNILSPEDLASGSK